MNSSKQPEKCAIFKTRQQPVITCPCCWTDQRAERNFCYQCGAKFIYLDERTAAKDRPAYHKETEVTSKGHFL